jgi:hypothetical protein
MIKQQCDHHPSSIIISSHAIIPIFISTFSNYRSKLALAAEFVNATNSRYGFSSNDLRKLGGSELSRIGDCIESDHGESFPSFSFQQS